MTEKANPSVNRDAEAFKTAGAIGYGGHVSSDNTGFVISGAGATEISEQDTDINESALDAFGQTSAGDSLDVTINGGEAFVYGSWLAIDVNTTVTLSSNTNDQVVYVGWNKDGSDDVIIGTSSAFASATGDTDLKIPLWEFDTNTAGVTNVTDRRRIGYTQGTTNLEGMLNILNAGAIEDSGNVAIDFDGSQNVTLPGGKLDIDGDDIEDGSTIIWDTSNQYIPQGRLQNDSVSINAQGNLTGGGSVDLGNTVDIGISEGSGSGLNADEVDGVNIYVQSSEPSSPDTDDIWVDTS